MAAFEDPTQKPDAEIGDACGTTPERPTPKLPADKTKPEREEREGPGKARERVTGGANPIDTGERGPTGPAAI